MKINQVEQQVGITKKNIRFYEEQGLLNPGRNKENGYRDYGEDDVRVLMQIKLLRKLGVPLEEIRLLQKGETTIADAMRRHRISLERQGKNLEQSMALCQRLQEIDGCLVDLDATTLLEEMETMERRGTSFSNKHRRDVKPISYIPPLVVTLIMVLLLVGFVWLLFWSRDTDEALPLAMCIIFTVCAVIMGGGMIYALIQRVLELQKGEVEDARKY